MLARARLLRVKLNFQYSLLLHILCDPLSIDVYNDLEIRDCRYAVPHHTVEAQRSGPP